MRPAGVLLVWTPAWGQLLSKPASMFLPVLLQEAVFFEILTVQDSSVCSMKSGMLHYGQAAKPFCKTWWDTDVSSNNNKALG